MKLIRGICEKANVQIVTEEKEGRKERKYFLEGIFLQSEVQNRNGRVYPHYVLKREVDRYVSEYVNKNRALGELSHPESCTVNPNNASHLIMSINEDGFNFIGKAKVLDTLPGKTVKALMEEGVQLGVSSRGMGSLSEVDGIQQVQKDYHLATIDIVCDPSAPDAFVNGILEGKEWVWDNGKLIEKKLESYKKDLEKVLISSKEREDKAIKIFQEYINLISKK